MTRTEISCPCCGKTLTADEIMAGESLVCPICDEKLRKERAKRATARAPASRVDEGRGGGCCGGGGCR